MNGKQTKAAWSEQERLLDEALEDTFPASDPVSKQQIIVVGRAQRPSLDHAPRVKTQTKP